MTATTLPNLGITDGPRPRGLDYSVERYHRHARALYRYGIRLAAHGEYTQYGKAKGFVNEMVEDDPIIWRQIGLVLYAMVDLYPEDYRLLSLFVLKQTDEVNLDGWEAGQQRAREHGVQTIGTPEEQREAAWAHYGTIRDVLGSIR